MATIVGSICTSHVPAIGRAIANHLQQDAYWKPFFDGFDGVHAWLDKVKPDVAVMIYNDHGLNFFLDKLPTFAVGAAPEYQNADEGWGIPVLKPFPGHQKMSWHLIESLVNDEFDITSCQEMLVDHAFSLPMELLWPSETKHIAAKLPPYRPTVAPDESPLVSKSDSATAPSQSTTMERESWPVKTIPVSINTVQHPLPSAARCFKLGQAIGRAIESYPEDLKVVVVGTGGLSHQLDGERAGFINKEFDLMCLDKLVNDPQALIQYSNQQLVELAGTQGVELLMWIAARGALTGDVREVHRNYHIPISNTASGIQVLENRLRKAKAA